MNVLQADQQKQKQWEMERERECAEKAASYANQCNSGIGMQLRTPTPEEAIDFLFTFHDNPDKTPHYIEIREAAKTFAKVLVRHVPQCGDRLTAVQKIREAVMFANAAVALDGRGL